MILRNLFDNHDPNGLSVAISDLLVATADGADPSIHQAVPQVLHQLREKLGMDVVFVSEFVDGERVFRFVDRNAEAPPLEAGHADPLEASFCQRVVDGRLPEYITDASALPTSFNLPALPVRVGAHLSTPIVLSDGRTYGTLCCFSLQANDHLQQQDLAHLRNCARLVARKVEQAMHQGQPGAQAWADTLPMG